MSRPEDLRLPYCRCREICARCQSLCWTTLWGSVLRNVPWLCRRLNTRLLLSAFWKHFWCVRTWVECRHSHFLCRLAGFGRRQVPTSSDPLRPVSLNLVNSGVRCCFRELPNLHPWKSCPPVPCPNCYHQLLNRRWTNWKLHQLGASTLRLAANCGLFCPLK